MWRRYIKSIIIIIVILIIIIVINMQLDTYKNGTIWQLAVIYGKNCFDRNLS